MKELTKGSLKTLKHIIGYVILLLTIVIACLVVKYNFMNEIQVFDNNVLSYINENFVSNNMTHIMKTITLFGSFWILIPLTLIFVIFMKNKTYGLLVTFNLLWVYFTNKILKHLFDRPRPVSEFITQVGASFPSGHAMCSTAFYGFIAVLINTKLKNKYLKILVTLFFSIFILLISFSRMYLQVHYFTDVLLGIMLGLICLGMFISILNYVKKEK